MRMLPACLIVLLPFGDVATLPADDAQPPGQVIAQTTVDLKMSVGVTDTHSAETLHFHLTIENAGDQDTVLNLGMMLGNGRYLLPDAIRLTLTDPDGESRELHFAGRPPGVAGRIDDYVLPLRAGSAHMLKLSLSDYWCPAREEFRIELEPETYGVHAEFTGNGAQHLNGDTEGLRATRFWMGTLRSDDVQFEIGEVGR